jgi:hypothetical protein
MKKVALWEEQVGWSGIGPVKNVDLSGYRGWGLVGFDYYLEYVDGGGDPDVKFIVKEKDAAGDYRNKKYMDGGAVCNLSGLGATAASHQFGENGDQYPVFLSDDIRFSADVEGTGIYNTDKFSAWAYFIKKY